MQSTIETRVVKVGDFVIIKEEYILYKGNPFEHVFIDYPRVNSNNLAVDTTFVHDYGCYLSIGTIDMTMSLYLFLDMYLHSGEYHVGTVGIDIRNYIFAVLMR